MGGIYKVKVDVTRYASARTLFLKNPLQPMMGNFPRRVIGSDEGSGQPKIESFSLFLGALLRFE